jgi:hypothetical protein
MVLFPGIGVSAPVGGAAEERCKHIAKTPSKLNESVGIEKTRLKNPWMKALVAALPVCGFPKTQFFVGDRQF